jgi:hypothetical protein
VPKLTSYAAIGVFGVSPMLPQDVKFRVEVSKRSTDVVGYDASDGSSFSKHHVFPASRLSQVLQQIHDEWGDAWVVAVVPNPIKDRTRDPKKRKKVK